MNSEWAEGITIAISVLVTCMVVSFGIYQIVTGQFIARESEQKIEDAYPDYAIELQSLSENGSREYYGVQAINIARNYCTKILVCTNTTATIPANAVYYSLPTDIPIGDTSNSASMFDNHTYTLAYFPADTANNSEDVLVMVDGGES